MARATERPLQVLTQDDYTVLGPDDFGVPGLQAIEILGPFVDINALGPLITVHDSTIEPHRGISHHPHRYNERIFYIMSGELDHDDSLNQITGHMDTGDVGLFTEGVRGMLHSEWNNGDVQTQAFILVYVTAPVPEETAFDRLRDEDAARYEEGRGVQTKELVGPRSGLRIHGDVRYFTDSRLMEGSSLEVRLGPGEGGLVSVHEGSVRLDEAEIPTGGNVLFAPRNEERTYRLEATGGARVLRVVHGPGFGLRRRHASPA